MLKVFSILMPKSESLAEYMKSGMIFWVPLMVVVELLVRLLSEFGDGTYIGPLSARNCGLETLPGVVVNGAVNGCTTTTLTAVIFMFVVQMGVGMLIGAAVYALKSFKK